MKMIERKRTTRVLRTALVLGCSLALVTACKSEPAGQVAAVVDGEDITLSQINTELGSTQVPEGADKKAMQQMALERVVERKLLANAARQDGLDQSPEFIIRKQQLEDALLVQLLTQKAARASKVPTAAEVSKFMADNPQMFAQRTLLKVDQIRFSMPSRGDYLKPLAEAKTMGDVVKVLESQGIKYERGNTGIDSAQLPAEMMTKIKQVPAGEPFVIPAGGMVTVSLITGSQAAPISGEQATPAATSAARNMALNQSLQQRLRAERAKAKIEYQPGFSPPKPGAKPDAAKAAPAAPKP